MKHAIKVFSTEGDTTVCEWEVEDAVSVEIARGVFEQATADGFGALVSTEEGAQALEEFQPEVQSIILLRPLAGG